MISQRICATGLTPIWTTLIGRDIEVVLQVSVLVHVLTPTRILLVSSIILMILRPMTHGTWSLLLTENKKKQKKNKNIYIYIYIYIYIEEVFVLIFPFYSARYVEVERDICCDRGKNRETMLSSLQACFAIAHSSGDFLYIYIYCFLFFPSIY